MKIARCRRYHSIEGGLKNRYIADTGFSLIELVVVLAIILLITVMALPQARNVIRSYRLNAAASAIKSAVQSTRYQAIMVGCPYQLVFTSASTNYQLTTEKVTGSPPACDTTFTTVSGYGAIPWTTTREVTISADTTLQFNPNGTVTVQPANTPPPSPTMTLSMAGVTRTVSISGVGNVQIK
jgi:type IV fimbrial biogenesis protein FimT